MTALRYCQIVGVDIPLDQGVYCQNGNNPEVFCAKACLYLLLLNVHMDLGLTRVPKYNLERMSLKKIVNEIRN